MRVVGVVVILIAIVAGVLLLKRTPPTVAVVADMAHVAPSSTWRGPTSVSLVGVEARREQPSGVGVFTGRVIADPSGVGVAHAELTFAFGESEQTTETDASGAFTFRPAVGGTYELVNIAAVGFAPYVAEQSIVRLEASPGTVVNGLLFQIREQKPLQVSTSDDKTALAGVQLAAHTPGTLALAMPRTASTGGDGNASISVSEGDLIEASHDGFATVVHEVSERDLKSGRVALLLHRSSGEPAKVAGVVLDDNDRPVEGAQVMLLGEREATLGEVVSERDGTFTLNGTGTHVRASKVPYVPAVEKIETDGGRLTLRLRSGCALHGNVTDSANPVASFTVVVARVAGRGDPPPSPTVYDAYGRFEIRGATPGSYALQVLAAGYAPSQTRVVVVPESCSVSDTAFTLGHGGSVYGRVTDATSGEPLVAQIQLEGVMGEGNSNINVKSSTRSDAQGRYEISGLPTGRRSIAVTADGHLGRIVGGIDIKDGDRIGPIDVTLEAAKEGEPFHFQLTGIGAVLRAGDGVIEVLTVMPTGGAAAAGIKTGDAITQVDDVPVASVGLDDAIQAIRGPENTTVTLLVRKKGDETAMPITVTRKVLR